MSARYHRFAAVRHRLGSTVTFLILSTSLGATTHGPDFWRSIKSNHLAVPAGESADNLALDAVNLAGAADPFLRDDCGYEIIANWVYQQDLVSNEQLEKMRRKLLEGMTFGLGEPDTTSIFRRSFSALYMSVLAARDLKKPFFTDASFRQTLDVALNCYEKERDLRGYIPGEGWAHATAHVPDLLKFLGRNSRLTRNDQRAIVEAIAGRARSAPSIFVWGEDGRMAAALLSMVNRKDLDPSIFQPWFDSLVSENRAVWAAATLNVNGYIAVRNQANVLTHVAAKIGMQQPDQIPAALRDGLNKAIGQIE
jgi:hypothetical protein